MHHHHTVPWTKREQVCVTCGGSFWARPQRYCSKACAKIRPLSERFVEKVVVSDGCELWMGARSGDGYGRIQVDGRLQQATHVAWFLHYGSWPTAEVCHECDRPACVRVDHLFLGSHHENMLDAARKGRIGVGLTLDLAREIRSLSGTYSQTGIAERYGISQSHVSRVVRGLVWREPDHPCSRK